MHSLHDYQGKWVILYFYPKDDTPGCTTEACSFRDLTQEFAAHNAVILGISKDSVASHNKFSKKYALPFPLLSDPEARVIKAYHAWGEKKFMGRTFQGTLRNTYLIDPEGEIAQAYQGVNPLIHAGEVLKDIQIAS